MSPFPCLRPMRGDPFRHSPIAAERCETQLKNAPGRCAPGRPPSSLPRPSASCPPHLLAYGGPPPASGGVSWPNIAFFPRHIHILSRPFRRCQQTQDTPVPTTRTAARVVLMHFLHYFSPHPSRHRKSAGTACPGAWLRCRKSIPSGDISGRGRPERDFLNLRQRQGKSSRTQGVLRHDPRAA